MADTLVEGDVISYLDQMGAGLSGPYWSDINTAVIIFTDGGRDIGFIRTTTKGASWTTTQIETGTVEMVAVWYDKETPGNIGTLVHVAWIDGATQAVYYIIIDVSDGSLGTKRTVDSSITAASLYTNRIAITKTVSGNIIVAFSTHTEVRCYKSSDGFATAGTQIADVFETPTEEDWCLLFPAATPDNNDACATFWDGSDDTITLKMYDDSANTWTEFATPIDAAAIYERIHMNMDGAVRHSDSHILSTWHSNDDAVGDDLRTAELTVDSIAAPSISAKTNIFTNQDESAQVSVFINQQNDDAYIAYLKGGTWQAFVDVVYHISTDGMITWGAEQSYSQAAADDIRIVSAGRTVGDDGGRYQPAFYNDDLTAIYINEVLDLELGVGAIEGQAALSGVGSMSAVPSLILSGSAVLSGIGTVSAAGTIGVIQTGAAVLSGVGSFTPGTPELTLVGQASFLGEGSLVAVGERGALGAALLAGVGSMSAIGEVAGLLEGRANLAGVGSLAAIGQRIVTGQVALAGAGAMSAAGVLVLTGIVTLSGVGLMAVIGESGVILYTQMGKRVTEWDASVDYPPDTLFYFEANLEVLSGVNKTAAARLYIVGPSDIGEVAGSEVLIPGPGPEWERSGSFSLPVGVRRYRVEYGGTSGGVYLPHGAAVRVVSS